MPKSEVAEFALYAPVEGWVKRRFSCWETAINTGPKVGRIHAVGVRDVGGDLSGRSEVIAVEVKAGHQPFANCAGQALGYSVMADRCYLADCRSGREPFTSTEQLIAGRLGVGLLAINSAGRITEVASAPPHEPIEELRLQVLEKLGLSLCSVCGSLFRRSEGRASSDFKRVSRAAARPGSVKRAVAEELRFVRRLEDAAAERDGKGRDATYRRR